jgi:hypothetical protein
MLIARQKSKINGEPVRVLLTGHHRPSKNAKTGEQVQVSILSASGQSPVQALQTGADSAVCGTCELRPLLNTLKRDLDDQPHKPCYVLVARSVLSMWRAHITARVQWPTTLKGRSVRLGNYGDPAAVNVSVWHRLIRLAKRDHTHPRPWTGFTHRWKESNATPYVRICMASVDTPAEQREAKQLGWRTFRVRRNAADPLLAGEISCPASKEVNRTTCANCLLCNGSAGPRDRRADIAIIQH